MKTVMIKENNNSALMDASEEMKKAVVPAEEYIKNMTTEDFMNPGIYKGLYKIEDKFRQNNVDLLLRDKAMELGKKKLESHYIKQKNSFFKMMDQEKEKKSPLKGTVDGMTNYSGLPENVSNLDCGTSWQATDEGVFFIADKIPRIACRQPVLITAILKSMETGEEKVRLIFRSDGKWTEITCDKDTLASAQKVTCLHKYGLSITSNNAKLFIAFLQDMEDYSRRNDLIPVIETVSRLGWNRDRTCFFPYTDTNHRIEFDGQGGLSELYNALEEKGNRELWYENFKKVRDIRMVAFLTAASLSAPIVGMLQTEGFIANLYGPSRGGKSVSSKIVCSIWAGHQNSDNFMYSMDNTVNSLEGLLAGHGNIPLFLEDANNMPESKQKELQTMIMKLGNGRGRGRMKQDASLRKVYTWATTGIITSENRITKDCHNTGSVNRVLPMRGTDEADCPYNKEGMDAGALLDFFGENHGFTGRDFIQALLEIGQDNLKKMLSEIQQEVRKKAEERKKSGGQVLPVSIMLLADKIAEEYLFHDGKRISVEEAVQWMENVDDADQYQRFYECLKDAVMQNSGKIEKLGLKEDMVIPQYWGRYYEDREAVALLPTVLKKLADENNVDVKLFLEFLDRKGLIEKDREGHFTKNVYSKLLNKGCRMHVISIPEVKDKPSVDGNQPEEEVEIPF